VPSRPGRTDGRRSPDLLTEVAGISLGASEGKGKEYQAQAQAIAGLCRLAGADEGLDTGVDRGGAAPRRECA
jgi:hypothetical protein